ncbi:Gfo/Idh/MocA family oxidoreductase [Lipingzhangella sp. LS1_29]|uniref:Gfo/Idh/MocA family oxidoreductase n=1 Tax=Lipingzhangella rawalii TaxID=2055835 RepID=A0ABU2HAV2_9ACTN|nr:Gfo/Idh/MocA family oxidoreductase [Lipingzhangella rawalii]MDS1272401.1 Gfo/Idh/MocA family oxidoreductase [Lipingzhangella rawalii]
MPTSTLRVALNGVTGRMGYNQHLVRSILAIADQGGVVTADGDHVLLEPVLVGRNPEKLATVAARHGLDHWSTDLDSVLADPTVRVYFDAQATSARESAVRAAIAAGKHVYAEKPVASSAVEARGLAELADAAGVRHGVVHDKLYLPGLVKLRRLVTGGFFGRILSVRGEFGYWVFEGDWQTAQRPSWNYRAEDGGGIVTDMFCHWNYVLEDIAGAVRAVTAHAATHIPTRWDEGGQSYPATADDAAYGIFELEGGAVAQINSSWCVRVHRDELVEFQVDGTEGSAVAGLRDCRVQHRSHTPRPVWNPDLPPQEPFRHQWSPVPENAQLPNGFQAQWEQFIRDVVAGTDHVHDFHSGVRGIRLAEAGLLSSREGRRVELDDVAAAQR